MDHMVPCTESGVFLHMFIVVANVMQSVLIAWLTSRAYRKDKREARERVERSEEP